MDADHRSSAPTRPVVALRPFTRDDREFFAQLARDERVTRFVGDGQPWDDATIEERTRAALENTPAHSEGSVRWFVAVAGIESVGLVVSARRGDAIEIGYWVSPAHWGCGVAGSMIDRALAAIPDVLGCGCLVARVDPQNTASARALTRRGFRRDRRTPPDDALDRYVLDPAG